MINIETPKRGSKRSADLATKAALKFMAFSFNNFEKNRRYLKTSDGHLNFSVGIRTDDNTVAQSIWFQEGRVTLEMVSRVYLFNLSLWILKSLNPLLHFLLQK